MQRFRKNYHKHAFFENEKMDIDSDVDVQCNSKHYKTIRVFGEGRYGTVYEGRHLATDQLVAIKVTSKQ